MLKIDVPCDPKPLRQVNVMLNRKVMYEAEALEKRRKHEEEMFADLLNYEEDLQTFIDDFEWAATISETELSIIQFDTFITSAKRA